MYVVRLLQINMVTLAVLGAMLLSMGQRSGLPLILVAAGALTSVWVTDIQEYFCLRRRVANVLIVLAVAVSIADLFPLRSEAQAINFAWFLIYLQLIHLFQRKDHRTYWLLIMLSLLQVVVATLFSQGIWFGVLLAVYMMLGFFAMTLLLLHRQWEQYRPRQALHPELVLSKEQYQRRPELVSVPGGTVQAAIGRELFGRLGRMGLHTLALTMVLFFAVPRFGEVAWRGSFAKPQSLVGFSDTVILGELGQIINNSEEVMRVKLFDHADGQPVALHEDLYLQGAVLMDYERGQWRAGTVTWDVGSQRIEPTGELPRNGLVRQETTIESLDADELFFISPFVPLEKIGSISLDLARLRLTRPNSLCTRRFEYRLGTTAVRDGRQLPLAPARFNESVEKALTMPSSNNEEPLPNVRCLARRWIAESGLPKTDRLGRARYIERKLAASGQFQYSLTGQRRNPRIDPIEDFLTEHRQGHCEYFATALVLMLRSQNIPARLVVGYKCDEWNASGGYFQVRQLHAHTWVEAYLKPEHIPPELMHGEDYWPWSKTGGWLRLDPTPASSDSPSMSVLMSPLRRANQWIAAFWSNYIVELNAQRQQYAIYQPISDALHRAWQSTTDPAMWRAMLDAAISAMGIEALDGTIQWMIAVAAAGLVAALLAPVCWLVWRITWAIMNAYTLGHGCATHCSVIQVEFYRRFETLLARQGIVRQTGQTQREFARTAGLQIATATDRPNIAQMLAAVPEAFYRVRFGRQPLADVEVQSLEHVLAELATINVRRPLACSAAAQDAVT